MWQPAACVADQKLTAGLAHLCAQDLRPLRGGQQHCHWAGRQPICLPGSQRPPGGGGADGSVAAGCAQKGLHCGRGGLGRCPP
jgi:hypothetical protein